MAIRRTTTGSNPVFVPSPKPERASDAPAAATPTTPAAAEDAFERAARSSRERLGAPPTNDGVAGGSTSASLEGKNPLSGQGSTTEASASPLPKGERLAGKSGPAAAPADPAQFSREARLRSLLDPGISATGGKGLSGQPSGQDLLDRAGKSPSADEGKNQSSRRSQASDDNEKIYDSAGSYVGTRGELEKMRADIAAADAEGGTGDAQLKDGFTDQELDRLGRDQEKDRQAGVKNPEEAARLKAEQEKDLAAQEAAARQKQAARDAAPKGAAPKGAGTRKRPNPEAEGVGGGAGHLGLPGRTPQTPEQAQASRRQQVTLPGDGRSKPDRLVAEASTAAREGQRQRTAGRIDPDERGPDLKSRNRPGLGTGRERVDGRRGPPGTSAPTRGPTPDNPTAVGDDETSGGTPPVD